MTLPLLESAISVWCNRVISTVEKEMLSSTTKSFSHFFNGGVIIGGGREEKNTTETFYQKIFRKSLCISNEWKQPTKIEAK